MKKINISLVMAVAFVFVGFSFVSAAELGSDVYTTNTVNVNTSSRGASMSASSSNSAHVTGNATSSNANEMRGNATSSSRNHGQMGSTTSALMHATTSAHVDTDVETDDDNDAHIDASHRSAVLLFVQGLLHVANNEQSIGERVRVIAMAQNDSGATTTASIEKVEGRGGFRTFLFGADYKNLGTLRSEMVKTSQQISQLKMLISQATTDADKAELNAQIVVLENDQAKIQQFVASHESRFSLFGWFVRLFN